MPTGGHFGKFLLDGAEHVRAPVLPLPLRLAAICAFADIMSGGIPGDTISGVIPNATRGWLVGIGVFRGILIAVRFFLHLLGQLLELLARTAGLIVVDHVSL